MLISASVGSNAGILVGTTLGPEDDFTEGDADDFILGDGLGIYEGDVLDPINRELLGFLLGTLGASIKSADEIAVGNMLGSVGDCNVGSVDGLIVGE